MLYVYTQTQITGSVTSSGQKAVEILNGLRIRHWVKKTKVFLTSDDKVFMDVRDKMLITYSILTVIVIVYWYVVFKDGGFE